MRIKEGTALPYITWQANLSNPHLQDDRWADVELQVSPHTRAGKGAAASIHGTWHKLNRIKAEAVIIAALSAMQCRLSHSEYAKPQKLPGGLTIVPIRMFDRWL